MPCMYNILSTHNNGLSWWNIIPARIIDDIVTRMKLIPNAWIIILYARMKHIPKYYARDRHHGAGEADKWVTKGV